MITNVRRLFHKTKIYGYIRVSIRDQNEQCPLHKMMEHDLEARKIFVNKVSGRNFDEVISE